MRASVWGSTVRTLVFSCLHVPHRPRPGSDAIRSTVDWLVELVQSQQVGRVIFLGDAVHNVSKANLPVNLWLRYVADSFKALSSQVFWMVGNHDIFAENMNAMQIFGETESFHLIQVPTVCDGGGCSLAFMPWMPYMDKPNWWNAHGAASLVRPGQPNFLFCHAPLEKFQKMVAPNDTMMSAPEDAVVAQFDAVFAGHYHGPGRDDVEVLGGTIPIIRPGCVLAQDFSDARLPAWFYGAVLWDYEPTQPDQFVIHWVANPHSHYFFKGTEAEYKALPEQARVLAPRTHFWFTEEPVEQPQGISVVVKPEQKAVESSEKTPYKLDSTPEEDLWLWLSEQDLAMPSAQVLLERGRKYLA
jgi:predicted phosphodiesterase